MADAAGGAAISNAGDAGNTGNTGNRPPRLNDNLAKAFAATVTILSTVGTISGIVAGFGKSGLDGLWVTLIISLAFALLIVIIVAIYFYRNNVISRRLPVLAAIGLLILLVGGGAGYAAGARADSAAPPPAVPTPWHSITATSAAPTSPPSTEPPTSTPSQGPSITPPPTAPPSASPPTAPSTAGRPAVIPVGPYRSFTDPKTTEVSAVAVTPDGNTLATADVNGGAFLFNIPTNSFIAGLYDPNGQPAWDVVFSPDGTTVADSTSDAKTFNKGSVYLWNVASPGAPKDSFRDPQGSSIGTIAFSPDGKTLAAADGIGSIYLLNAATLAVTGTLQGPSVTSGYGLEGLAFSRDGSTLAGAGGNGAVYVWNVQSRALVDGSPLYDPNNKEAKGIALSPDGSLVAVADTNGSAYLWNLASGNGQVVKTFHDPAGLQVMGVAFTPDGGALVTTSQSGKGDYDNAIRVWNVATGTLIHTFSDASKYGPGRLALSRDGQFLAVADADAEAYVWQLNWLHA